MDLKKTYYLTTPIFYPSGKPHIGHAFTSILADFLKRFYKQRGHDVFFLTGTDEHGKKIAQKASIFNQTPQAFVDEHSILFKTLFKLMQIDYDYFVRSSNPEHEAVVQRVFTILLEKQFIYLGEWEGLYCVECEENYTSIQAQKKADQKLYCRIGHLLEMHNEKSYFIKVSQFESTIKQALEKNEFHVFPAARINELINNFINSGLKDLSITRETVSWGVAVPHDLQQTIYVWFDALFCYLSAAGYLSANDQVYKKFWTNENCEIIHLLSKEITRFHCIYWPIFLWMLDVKTPTQFISHGWIIDEQGCKMSKSLGNVIDPIDWINKYGNDGVRYYLLKEMDLANDNRCGENLLISVFNSDLANNLGNLVSRTIGMLQKYQNSIIVKYANFSEDENMIMNELQELPHLFNDKVELHLINEAINLCVSAVLRINKLIENTKPWELYKLNKTQELANVLYLASATIRSVFILLEPILINKSCEVFNQMNFSQQVTALKHLPDFDAISNIKVNEPLPLFKRIEIKKQ